MMANSLKGLVAFGFVEKVSILSDLKNSYLVITPKEGIDIPWPEEVDLGYEKLKQSDELPKDLRTFVDDNAIIYKVSYTEDPKLLPKYMMDFDISVAKAFLDYLNENVPENLVYTTFNGMVLSLAVEKALPVFAPGWSILSKMIENAAEGKEDE